MNDQRNLIGTQEEEISLGWLIKSLVHGAVESVRRNKLAAVLAAATLVVLVVLAVDNRFDGLSEYQEDILPRLMRLETVYANNLRFAEQSSADWRLYYFKTAHSQVQDILRAARLDRPDAYVAARKHREFIRYYDLIDAEFHRIEVQLKEHPDMDYLRQLSARTEELKPIRDRWAQWALQNSKSAHA